MAKSRGLRTGPLPDRLPLRHEAPAPAGRVPPFVLVRQLDGDLLIAPFAKRNNGPTPSETVMVQTVAQNLARGLPVGCFWVDPQDGRATTATIAVPQLRRRLQDCASFNLRMP